MTWKSFIAAYEGLQQAVSSGAALDEPWANFAEVARGLRANPNLAPLDAALREAAGGRDPTTLRVLEHGCASGKTTMALWAWGVVGACGVDIFSAPLMYNRVATEVLGLTEPRFHKYDGRSLPFADSSFDLVFSQQVIEHVADDVYDNYYAEEGRVLKPGGIAYHQVPHRLAPLDTHTNTWFVHYLPRHMRRPFYRWLGHDPDYVEDLLNLRMPGTHRAMAERLIGATRDMTIERLKAGYDAEYYKGTRWMRRLLGICVKSQAGSRLLAPILRNLAIIDTVSVKRS